MTLKMSVFQTWKLDELSITSQTSRTVQKPNIYPINQIPRYYPPPTASFIMDLDPRFPPNESLCPCNHESEAVCPNIRVPCK